MHDQITSSELQPSVLPSPLRDVAALPGNAHGMAGAVEGEGRVSDSAGDRANGHGEVERPQALKPNESRCLPGLEPERRTKLSINFVIPGEPKGKGRARSRIAKGKGGQQFVAHYTPKDTVEYENLVRMAAYEAMDDDAVPTSHPCAVTIIAYCSVPASWSQRKRAKALIGEVFPTGKPDLDNIEKAVLDGMNKIVFRDDSVVCDVVKRKRYGLTPRVEVSVRELDGEAA